MFLHLIIQQFNALRYKHIVAIHCKQIFPRRLLDNGITFRPRTLIDHLVDNTDSTSAWMFPGYPANYIHTIPFIIDKNKFNVRIRLVKGRQ